MDYRIRQTSSLLRFLKTIDVSNDTRVLANRLDGELTFTSKYYTPNLILSELAVKALQDIKSDVVPHTDTDINKESIVNSLRKTDLAIKEPGVYQILQTIVLEAFALINSVTESPTALKYVTKKDIALTRENINYVSDYLGDYPDYITVLDKLRELDISFGYIENQLDLMKVGVVDEV